MPAAESTPSILPEVEDTPKTKKRRKPIHIPQYHVLLLDDDYHSYDYVIEMLMDIFGHSQATAFAMACEVDSRGKVIVDTTTQERAELKRDQIHAYGADWRIEYCEGSMSAKIEPAC